MYWRGKRTRKSIHVHLAPLFMANGPLLCNKYATTFQSYRHIPHTVDVSKFDIRDIFCNECSLLIRNKDLKLVVVCYDIP